MLRGKTDGGELELDSGTLSGSEQAILVLGKRVASGMNLIANAIVTRFPTQRVRRRTTEIKRRVLDASEVCAECGASNGLCTVCTMLKNRVVYRARRQKRVCVCRDLACDH